MGKRNNVTVEKELNTATDMADDGGDEQVESQEREPVVVQRVQFGPLRADPGDGAGGNLGMLMDVGVRVAVELGRASMSIRDVLALTRGSVVELDKLAGEAVDVYVNDTLIARGEVVVVGEKFGVRVTEVVAPNRPISLGALQ